MRPTSSLPKRSSNKAAALIIVLAFVVILTGLAVAYLSRATTDRQLAHTSFHDTDADLLARSALDIVIGDFEQEIKNGSTLTPVSGTTVFIPTSPANVVPMRSGNPTFSLPEYPNDPIPNLIRRSIRLNGTGELNAMPAPGLSSRASATNSTTASANQRSVSLARWNSHYLIPRDPSATGDDSTPVNTFVAPDWVLVTRNGPTPFPVWNPALKDPTSTNTTYAVGRYAYAVYDEGGLLDINVAGYPTSSPVPGPSPTTTDIGRKGVLAFADLTALPTTPGNYVTTDAINKFILFRNYATMGRTTLLGDPTSLTSGQVLAFVNYYLGSPQIGTSQDFGQVNRFSSTASGSLRTDQSFINRAELINFVKSTGIADVNALRYLGTFSREQNKPTLPLTPAWPASNRIVLPQRFYLGNLDLVQATTGTPTPTPTGTPTPTPTGTPTPTPSIRTSFGLQMGPNGRWQYVGPPPGSTPLPAIPTPAPGGSPAPDFFQTLSYAYSSPAPTPTIDKILSLGAAIIDLYDYDTPSQVTTGIEYAPGPAVAGGGEGCYPNPCTSAVMMGSPTPTPTPIAGYTPAIQTLQSALVQNQRFRNSGEMGYAYNPISTRAMTAPTLDFIDAPPPIGTNIDAYVLDFFTYNKAPVRSGIVSLNTRQPPVLAAILKGAIYKEDLTPLVVPLGDPTTGAIRAANDIVNAAAVTHALSRADIPRLASAVTAPPFTSDEEARDTIARALSEVVQTRTWGLLIDVVAQTGHYKPNATGLDDFVVEGEKRYWLHVAIDRFEGSASSGGGGGGGSAVMVLAQQLEEVTE